MKIYYSEILADDGFPLVWELDKNQATCLFYSTNAPNLLGKSRKSLASLNNIPGVLIEHNKAIIKDVRIFKEHYMVLSPPKRGHSVSACLTESESIDNKPPLKRVSSLVASIIPNYDSILLDLLIKQDDSSNPGLWGDTISYEDYFAKKTLEDTQSRKAMFLKSVSTFNIMALAEKNSPLYPLKGALVKEIRELMKILDPFYIAWYRKHQFHFTEKELMCRYFQEAVHDSMLNGIINNKPTSFELNTEKLHPGLHTFAVDHERYFRTELMLMKFHVLVNPTFSLDGAISIKEEDKRALFRPLLQSLCTIIQQQEISPIQKQLQKMSDLIVLSGKVEEIHPHKQLHLDLKNKKPIIMNYHSFRALLETTLSTLFKEKQLKPYKLMRIVNYLTYETIEEIQNAFFPGRPCSSSFFNRPKTVHFAPIPKSTLTQYIAPLSFPQDQDFYLCPDWNKELYEHLKKIKLDSPKSSYKNIPEQVLKFLCEKLKVYIPELKTAAPEKHLSINLL